MTWPVHNRFVVRGVYKNTAEIWSNTLHFKSDFAADPDNHPSDWDADAVDAAVNTFYGGNTTAVDCAVVGWRGYRIDASGHLDGEDMVRRDYDTQVSGTGNTRYPPQVSLVISLLADVRGPAKFGRIYLPAPNDTITGSTFEISTSQAQAWLTLFKSYVGNLLDAMYPPLITGEALINVSPGGGGTAQTVTQYKCGLAFDTMRSRRNKLLENYEVQSA